MFRFIHLVVLLTSSTIMIAYKPIFSRVTHTQILLSNNADLFGANSSPDKPSKSSEQTTNKPTTFDTDIKADAYKTQAAKLRQEAAEMEVALREEARAKGVPEEMINKLVPIRTPTSSSSSTSSSTSSVAVIDTPIAAQLSPEELRKKLGYLNSGDAIRFTSELDRIKSKGLLKLWNSKAFTNLSRNDFKVSNTQLKMKTQIDSVKLKLDDVGFAYQSVLFIAIAIGSIFGLLSSLIGGQIGFLLGYSSALFPILLVGVGSIAPAAIGDIINQFKYATNSSAKDKYILQNAAKFLVCYCTGLPISSFSANGRLSNSVEFFQIRPDLTKSTGNPENRQMFAKKFDEFDISRCAMTCLASNVAECLVYGEASGTTAADVGLLYEVLNSVDPPLKPEDAQNYIRWAAVNTYDILVKNRVALDKLTELFGRGVELEECIAAIEANKD